MKKVVFAAVLFAAGTFAKAQQSPATDSQQAEMAKMKAEKMQMKKQQHLAQMKEELGLSQDQMLKIEAMHNKHRAERKVQMDKSREVMKQNIEQMKAKKEARNAEMKAILTPEQYAKWQEGRAAKMAKHKADFRNKKQGMTPQKKVRRTVEPLQVQ